MAVTHGRRPIRLGQILFRGRVGYRRATSARATTGRGNDGAATTDADGTG